MVQVAALAQIESLAWEIPYPMQVAGKEKICSRVKKSDLFCSI